MPVIHAMNNDARRDTPSNPPIRQGEASAPVLRLYATDTMALLAKVGQTWPYRCHAAAAAVFGGERGCRGCSHRESGRRELASLLAGFHGPARHGETGEAHRAAGDSMNPEKCANPMNPMTYNRTNRNDRP